MRMLWVPEGADVGSDGGGNPVLFDLILLYFGNLFNENPEWGICQDDPNCDQLPPDPY